jgi:hypothetical protein
MIVNYDPKSFIVQATEQRTKINIFRCLKAFVTKSHVHMSEACWQNCRQYNATIMPALLALATLHEMFLCHIT